jgi:AraC-like DNA-binding protein
MDHITKFKQLAVMDVGWNEIFDYIERHNMNAPACLALAIKLWANEIHCKPSQVIKNLRYDRGLNKRYAMYAEDIEKYLMLT